MNTTGCLNTSGGCASIADKSAPTGVAFLPTDLPESAGLCAEGSPRNLIRVADFQRPGLVARGLRMCTSVMKSGIPHPCLYGGCAQGAFGRAGFPYPPVD